MSDRDFDDDVLDERDINSVAVKLPVESVGVSRVRLGDGDPVVEIVSLCEAVEEGVRDALLALRVRGRRGRGKMAAASYGSPGKGGTTVDDGSVAEATQHRDVEVMSTRSTGQSVVVSSVELRPSQVVHDDVSGEEAVPFPGLFVVLDHPNITATSARTPSSMLLFTCCVPEALLPTLSTVMLTGGGG